jgi:hypothetical protein
MTLRWCVYSEVGADIRDEEALNDCFADLIDDTLTRGPGFLNYLLDGLVEFEPGARIEGTDRETLPDVDGSTVRIDLTVGDDSKIVGFESKRRDNLTEGQLRSELEKLEHNADGRDVRLVAITEHLSEPELVSTFSDQVCWTSWFRIAQRSFDADLTDDSWKPTVSRANKMFREFGYNEFDGIDTAEFNICVWELWKQTATQMEGINTGTRWPYNMLKESAGTSKGYRPVDPDWMLLTFNNPNTRPSQTCYALLANKKTNEIWAGVATHPNQNENVRELFCENADRLADQVIEEELDVIQFPLNWLVGRKNLPEGHRKNVRAKYPETRDELVEAFTDRKGMENDGANWFILAYPVDLSKPLKDSVDALTTLQDLFNSQTNPSVEALLD